MRYCQHGFHPDKCVDCWIDETRPIKCTCAYCRAMGTRYGVSEKTDTRLTEFLDSVEPALKKGKQMPMVHLFSDEVHAIANALNSEAAHFDALCQDSRFRLDTHRVWKEKAGWNREMSEKLINSKQPSKLGLIQSALAYAIAEIHNPGAARSNGKDIFVILDAAIAICREGDRSLT